MSCDTPGFEVVHASKFEGLVTKFATHKALKHVLNHSSLGLIVIMEMSEEVHGRGLTETGPDRETRSETPSSESAVTYVNRGSTFALRRSTLDFCLGGQRSLKELVESTFGEGSSRVLLAVRSLASSHSSGCDFGPPIFVVSYGRGTPVVHGCEAGSS